MVCVFGVLYVFIVWCGLNVCWGGGGGGRGGGTGGTCGWGEGGDSGGQGKETGRL